MKETPAISRMSENDLKSFFVRRHDRPGDIFMETLRRDGVVIAPGVYDAMGGFIARKIYEERKKDGLSCAYNAVYEGHWSTSAMLLRKPDMGFGDLDFLSLVGKFTVAAAYPLPVIFDIETGFGNATTITRTVEKCDEIGVSVIHLEDQEDSGNVARRCGNQGGKWCAEIPSMLAKIKSCLTMFKAIDTSIRLMVRTDAITAANGGFENAVERGKRYMDIEVGGLRPTILWADAMYSPDNIDYWIETFRKFDPNIILGINYSPNRDWTPETYREKFGQDPPTYKSLYQNGKGFSVIWHTILQARTDMESTWNIFEAMASHGEAALWRLHERQRNHPVGDAQAMSGVKEWQAYEKHIGGEEVAERYEKSKGYKETERNN